MRLRDADSEAFDDDVSEETLQLGAGRGPAMNLSRSILRPVVFLSISNCSRLMCQEAVIA